MPTLSGTTTAFVDGQPIEYRLRSGPGAAVVVLHGAHMSAHCGYGESRWLPAEAQVLVPSRPGYGRTSVAAGPSVPEFSIRLAGLCRRLELRSITAVGISMGARTALTLAAQQPQLVSRVVLISPVSFAPWPDPRTRPAAWAMFNPLSQGAVWGLVHGLLRNRPDIILPTMVRGLTTLPPHVALRRMGGDLDELVRFLASCRSDRGFVTDLRPPVDVTTDVAQPTLVLATRNDASVRFDHPERLARSVQRGRLTEIDSPSHLLWLGDGWQRLRMALAEFLG
jgi:pimeloyl-ACP methyl ester carboxylesterase